MQPPQYPTGPFETEGPLSTPRREELIATIANAPAILQKAVAGLTEERICSVRQPVVALYDEHSPFLLTCRYLEEHLPNCTVEIVPGAKHMAPVQNGRLFVELVRKHLAALRRDSSEASRCISQPSC